MYEEAPIRPVVFIIVHVIIINIVVFIISNVVISIIVVIISNIGISEFEAHFTYITCRLSLQIFDQ